MSIQPQALSMQSQVHEIDPVTVELEVKVPWDRVEQGLNAGYGKLQKSAKIRGFRQGKVPRNVLQRIYGPQVHSEVIQSLVEQSLYEAVQEHSLAVVATPEMEELPRIESGQPLAFKAKLEVRPKVDEVVFEGLEIARRAERVEESEIDSEIQRLREREAEIITPDEPRPAQKGDLLTLAYTVEVDGEPKPDMDAQDRTVELGADRLLPEFEVALAGKSVGDTVDITVSYDEEVQSPDLKGKRAVFKVSISELKEKRLPELDDEFAKDLGEVETLAELRAKTRERLESAASRRAASELREQVVERLVERNAIPVPPSLITQQERAMQKELAYFLQLTGQKELDPTLASGLRVRAERKVRAAILMGEIARRQSITVSDAEVDAKLAAIAEETGKHIAKVRVEYAGEKRESLESKLLEDKLLDFLIERATVSDAPLADATAASE